MTKGTITLRAKNQLTLPAKLIETLGLEQGDLLIVSIDDSAVRLTPAAVVERGSLAAKKDNGRAEADIRDGRHHRFDSAKDVVKWSKSKQRKAT